MAVSAEATPAQTRPWDQQPQERAKAYAAFRIYLELGVERSVPETARRAGKAESLMWRWAARYTWRDRARAWDAELMREREHDLRRQRIELRERRFRRAKETDTVGRLLVNHGLRRDPLSGEVHGIDRSALEHGQRFLRLATDVEDRCLEGTEPGTPERSIEEELWGTDDAALRRLIEQARGTNADQQNGDGSHGETGTGET